MAEHTTHVSLLDATILQRAVRESFIKLHPRTVMRNPVMFVVEVVAAVTSVLLLRDLLGGGRKPWIYRPHRRLAVVYRALCQLRRGGRRRPGQSPGRQSAAHQDADDGQTPAPGGET